MRDWRSLIGKRGLSPEAVDELAQHLEDCFQAVVARGGTEADALKTAEAELASLSVSDKRSLDIRTPRVGLAERIRQFVHIDLRDAFRRLRRSPGFSLLAIGVLAVGLGVNTAIFTLINAALFKPLPVKNPESLVFVYDIYPKTAPSIRDDYEALAARKDLFSELAGYGGDQNNWATIDGRLEMVIGAVITENYLSMLGVTPQLGRGFGVGEDAASAEPTVLISDSFWKARFNTDPNILGRRIRLMAGRGITADRGRDYTIVGVLPPGFNGTGTSASWLTPSYWVLPKQRDTDFICAAEARYPGYPWVSYVVPVGRLNDGVTVKQAAQALRNWLPPSRASRPLGDAPAKLRDGEFIEVTSTRQVRLPYEVSGQLVPEQVATALITVSGLVLVIAVANLAGLLLARGVTGRGEIAVRLSLGAGRWRIARQQITGSLVLTIIGGLCSIPIAGALARLIVANLPTQTGGAGATIVSFSTAIDARVLMFSAVACLLAGIVVGVPSARQASRTDVLPALQQAAGSSHSRKRLRHLVVIPQIGLSLTLLIVTGAVARTIVTSELAPPGYQPEGLVAVGFSMPRPDACEVVGSRSAVYEKSRQQIDALRMSVAQALPGLPSLASSALSDLNPYNLTGGNGGSVVTPESHAMGRHFGVRSQNISPEFFDTLGIQVIAGRTFLQSEVTRTGAGYWEPGSAIVSRTLAAQLWPGQQAVGQVVARHQPDAPAPKRWAEVVGVVDDVLPALNDGWPAPTIYFPSGLDAWTVVARARGSTSDAIRDITNIVLASNPSAVILRARTFVDDISERRFTRRLAVSILGIAAMIGLALAAIGLYGVVSYSLAQRLREFGIRAALGASYADLVRLVIVEGVFVATVGSVIGLAAAYSAIGLISSKLVAIPSVNVAIVIAGPAIVFIAVALACYLPARRAARVDPLVVLRGL
jgi:predicted permease